MAASLAIGALAVAAPAGAVAPSPSNDEPEAAGRLLVTVEQRPSWRVPRAGTTARGYDRGYAASARTRRAVRRLAADYGLHEVAGWPIEVLGVHCVVFEVPADESAAAVVERLRHDPRVESAQPMHHFSTRSAEGADPYLDLQYGMESTQVNEAHRWALGTGVRVALIDAGVDLAHPDLTGRVAVARDFVDDTPPERWSDRHGTAVAGVLASTAGNGLGIAGVAPAVDLMALRACWPETPNAAAAVCDSFTLAKALSFAVERRAQVINLSLGGPPDPLLERLLRRAMAEGAIVVAAFADDEGGGFPGTLSGVLAVGEPRSMTTLEARSRPVAGLAAPGVDVLTTVPGGGFDFVSGSSLSAAHVSGIVALLLEKNPRLSAERLGELLRATSRVVAQPGGDRAELVNACAALASILPQVDCVAAEPPPIASGL